MERNVWTSIIVIAGALTLHLPGSERTSSQDKTKIPSSTRSYSPSNRHPGATSSSDSPFTCQPAGVDAILILEGDVQPPPHLFRVAHPQLMERVLEHLTHSRGGPSGALPSKPNSTTPHLVSGEMNNQRAKLTECLLHRACATLDQPQLQNNWTVPGNPGFPTALEPP